jgi:tellurite resistance protein TerC
VNQRLTATVRGARRISVALLGGSVLALGVAMLILPGPAVVVIPTGLAILALEFLWARRFLRRVRERAAALAASQRDDPDGPGAPRERR